MHCKTCRNYHAKPASPQEPAPTRGACRAHPPQAALIPGAPGIQGPTLQLVSYGPEVSETDWCGEYVGAGDDLPSLQSVMPFAVPG